MEYEDWYTIELAELLVAKGVYPDTDSAMKTDRCDLIRECKDEE